jgi:hypothetical protein
LGAIWLASLEARTRVEAIVSGCEGRDVVRGKRRDACGKEGDRKGTGFFLNGVRKSCSWSRDRREKRGKSEEGSRGARKNEKEWSALD